MNVEGSVEREGERVKSGREEGGGWKVSDE